MQFSSCLPSPYSASAILDDVTLGPCIRIWRQQQLHALQRVAKFLRPWEDALRATMHSDVKDVAAQRCPALLTCIAHLLRWPDTTVGLRFVLGFRCIGAIEAPGLFRELDEAPPHSLGLQTLLGQHATNILNKLELSTPRFPHSAEAKAFTLQEIQQGIAEGPFNRCQLDARFGEGQWVPTRASCCPNPPSLGQ